ncbi:hypothetical protein DFS34DRAFT_645957 [Phlyctochytrium arcticum]|nr:hypothetical protein DFS34DRAFT_645957 [Phlyctochytrium arcticum]
MDIFAGSSILGTNSGTPTTGNLDIASAAGSAAGNAAGSAAAPTAAGVAGTAASMAAGAAGTTTIVSVVDLFLEFDVGWKGGPAIQALEAAKYLNPALNWHGTKEMGGHTNCKAWICRKFIIKGIQKIARKKSIPESDVAVRLENRRLSEICNKKHNLRKGSTLNSMNNLFKAGGAPLAKWLDSITWGEPSDE